MRHCMPGKHKTTNQQRRATHADGDSVVSALARVRVRAACVLEMGERVRVLVEGDRGRGAAEDALRARVPGRSQAVNDFAAVVVDIPCANPDSISNERRIGEKAEKKKPEDVQRETPLPSFIWFPMP